MQFIGGGIDVSLKFEIGDRVKIQKGSYLYSSYHNKYYNHIGLVERISGSYIGVKIDNLTNTNSSYGVFWFYQNELEIIDKENIINNKEEYFMDKNYNMVKAKYLDTSISKIDFIFAAYESYEVNDYVVVNSGHHGFVIAQVTAVEDVDGKVEYGREIICKIDMTAYNDRKARAKRKAELKSKMEAKVKELQETAIFEMLAKEDTGLAEMLKEFKELG